LAAWLPRIVAQDLTSDNTSTLLAPILLHRPRL